MKHACYVMKIPIIYNNYTINILTTKNPYFFYLPLIKQRHMDRGFPR